MLLKRANLILLFVILVASSGFFYVSNKEMLNHYKPYYFKSYIYAAELRASVLRLAKVSDYSSQSAKSIPVLVYHGILDNSKGENVSLDEFKKEMYALKSAGYQTVHIKDFYEFIQGKKKLPEKSFLLTFDDGRKETFYPADPILEALNYSAVMFMISGTLKSDTHNYHLIKSEAKSMVNSGRWDLEAHAYKGHGLVQIDAKGTRGRFYSNKIWLTDKKRLETDQEFRQRTRNDLMRVKSDLKKYFGINSIGFAFPFNDYARESLNFPGAKKIFDEEVRRLYGLLFYQVDTDKGYKVTNFFDSKNQLIKRINVDGSFDENKLLLSL